MATPTVDHSRAHALVRRIARLDAEPARLEAVALGLVDALLEGRRRDPGRCPRRPPRRPRAGQWRSGAGRVAGRGHRLRALGARARAIAGRRGPGNAGPRLPARARRLAAAGKRGAAPPARDRRDPGEPYRPPAAGERSRHSAQGRPPGVLAADPARAASARGGARPAAITQLGVLAGGPPTRLRGGVPATSPASPARSTPPASESSSARSSCTPAGASRRPRGRRSPTRRACRWRPWRRCSPLTTTWSEAAASTSWRACSCRRRPSARGLRRRLVGERADPPPGRDVLRRLRARSGRHHGRAPRAQGCAGGGRVDGRARQHVRRPRRRGAAPATPGQLLGRVPEGAHRPRGVANPA